MVWTGHVTAEGYGQDGVSFLMAITAGFSDANMADEIKSDATGCFGEWKEEYGVKIDEVCEA